MGRANYDRAQYGRSSILRPKYSRAAYRTPEDSPITITAAVLTFTSYWERLTLTLSAAPGDATWVGASGMSWVGAATTWSPGDIADADCVLVGTTLTITTYSNAFGSITNYSPSQDLFQYDGSDSTNLPNVAAVTNLPVTFTGGPLAVLQTPVFFDSFDLTFTFSITLGTFNVANVFDAINFANGSNFGDYGGASLQNAGTSMSVTGGVSGGSTSSTSASYNGTDTNVVDNLGRPVPPCQTSVIESV